MRSWLMMLLVATAGCQKEPTVTVRFEPTPVGGAVRAEKGDLALTTTNEEDIEAGALKRSPGPAFKDECKENSDCVLQPVDCCDCSSGGKQHAVPKKSAMSAAVREKKCKEIKCAMFMSNDPSCSKRASCFAGHCVLK